MITKKTDPLLSQESIEVVNLKHKKIGNNGIIKGLKMAIENEDWEIVNMVLSEVSLDLAKINRQLENYE